MKQLQQIKLILEELESEKLLRSVDKIDFFYDEPKFFRYACILQNVYKFTEGIIFDKNPSAGGISPFRREEALLKCLVESAERISLAMFRKKNFFFETFPTLKKNALDPFLYYSIPASRQNTSFGWMTGKNLYDEKEILLPAQLIFLNFRQTYAEPFLTTTTSSGVAAGFSHEETLLRAILEAVERDAFLAIYLLRISPPQINLARIKDERINNIIGKIKRYKLEMYVFDITTDIGIPVFASLIMDKTGFGPGLSIGLKSSFDEKDAIIGSMMEACGSRFITRTRIIKDKLKHIDIVPDKIRTFEERGFIWYSPEMLKHIRFFFQGSEKTISLNNSKLDTDKQLKTAIKLLHKKGLAAYYADATPEMFRKIGLLVYKAIIPGLQPVFFNEANREIKKGRLTEVARYFGKQSITINNIPHPFL